MREKRIAVLVSGGGSNLQALIDAQGRGDLGGGRIVAVIASKAGVFALDRAQKAGIPGYVLARKDFADSAAMTRAIVDRLRALEIDLVVLAGFLHILTAEIVAAYPNAILNIHPALIPAFCGAGYYGLHVHEKVLEYGAKLTGATVHFVSEEPDGGPIVLQKAVEVRPEDSPETLQRRVMEEAEWQL
ncbi:MAG: phosphoribosylglycinamide formyltransferase, partial [Pseudoflavonifractor sp.]